MWDRAVDTGTRVAIPIPDATPRGCIVDEFDIISFVAESFELIDAAETTSDYESVEFDGSGRRHDGESGGTNTYSILETGRMRGQLGLICIQLHCQPRPYAMHR